MFKLRPIALAAALCGSSSVASAAGCHPAYVPGASYSPGDVVSATSTETTTSTVSCTVGDAGCGANGFKTETTTTSETHNYECTTNAAWCSSGAYDPTGQYSSSAWTKEGAECAGTATPATPAAAVIPAAWNGGGCPVAFAAGTAYDAADVVSVAMTGYSMVYQCAAEPQNQYCGASGFEPGTSQYWEQAWSELGSCTGTIAPTTTPSFDSLTDKGGCPSEYAAGEVYEAGDEVSKDGLVYRCKPDPLDRHCSQAGYEPGASVGFGAQLVEYWKDAWDLVGYCSGTIAPTTSPVFVSLVDVGGCPSDWAPGVYEEGDRVHSMGLVYACNSWPLGAHCGQAGYEPNTNPATPDAWKAAWTVIGYCSGTSGPTGAPTFDAANSVGACPEGWERGSNVKYEEGDMVSVTVSSVPLRMVAFVCKGWPQSGHCGQYSPLENGGTLGWTFAGSCDGFVGPTASPSFDALAVDASGCPEEWSASKKDYEAGDLVSYSVSAAPTRKVVFKCREFPNDKYCNQAAFEPTTKYAAMAWTLEGACSGSIAPTSSPIAYIGTCQFERCAMVYVACSPGEGGCSCWTGVPAGPECLKEVRMCAMTDVEPWSASKEYATGDVVRVGSKQFKCKEWPYVLWCSNESYRPEGEDGIWDNAWTAMGDCPP